LLVSAQITFRPVVSDEEASRLVAAYARALTRAQQVRELLVLAGLDGDAVLVVPSWTQAGEPVVYVSGLTARARQCLADIVGGDMGPPPDDDRGGGQRVA
jgi:hypothetical protein